MTAADDAPGRNALWLVLAVVGAVTLARAVVLMVSPLNLYPDEAQYWWWAQTPAFGYFSKPPMIAWVIRLATALFGNAEWAIRLCSPLLHAGTSLFLFAISRRVFSVRIAVLSSLAYLTTPGISYSSGLMSTDAPLLFFWAAALYALLRAFREASWRWPVLCGIALGLGLLSKYAMLYIFVCAAIAAVVVPDARRLLLGAPGFVILVIGLALIAPNILWNAGHGFPTVAHTAANAHWDRARYSPLKLATFLIGQFGVFGPVLMAGLIAALWRLARQPERPAEELLLAAFSVPPLALMLAQSFIAHANANWAAPAFVAGTPLAVNALARTWRCRALWLSFAVNGLVMGGLWAILAEPDLADAIGLGNAFKREEGWSALGRAAAREAGLAPYEAIVTDNRSMAAEMLYYAMPRKVPIRVWDSDLKVSDHFQMTLRLERPARRVLLAVSPPDAAHVLPTFESARLVNVIAIPVGGAQQRVTQLYNAQNYRGPVSGR